MATEADIAVMGGAAGGGKSWCLIAEPLRHIHNPKFGAVLFRRTSVQVRIEGGLWDESEVLYPLVGGTGLRNNLRWRFPSGATVQMAHLEHDRNRFDWQGAQIPLIEFDELTHFSEAQFWYMLSRNRSTSGVRCYVRATCNPDPESFVAKLVDWWINPDTGYPIPERSGALRWFVRIHNRLEWADTPSELKARLGPEVEPKSFTFIPANLADNRILTAHDPGYAANLKALPYVDRMRLLEGNWKVRATAGTLFRRHWFGTVDAAPAGKDTRAIRYWDRAATEAQEGTDPDWTAGVLLVRHSGTYFVRDVVRFRGTPRAVEEAILNTAQRDGDGVDIGIEQDPGQSGKMEADYYVRALAGFNVRSYPVRGDKVTRAKPVSAQAEAGNLKMVRGSWNEALLEELENFPDGGHDDQVDALSGAFGALIGEAGPMARIQAQDRYAHAVSARRSRSLVG